MTPQSSANTLPKVIFLDAMGTLFDLKSSVGEIYQQYALKYGVKADAQLLNNAFINSFKSAPKLAFTATKQKPIEEQEFDWWKNVVQTTFFQLGLLKQFSDFTDFFREIYTYFATEDPWYVFPDVFPMLQKWKYQKVQLGVISNFDSRLHEVLTVLNLEHFFTTITISSMEGFAKPDQKIFNIALKKHQLIPQQAWHIGDSLIEDYQGAKNVGIRAFWLNRSLSSRKNENQLPNLSSLG
ncbi:HAD-IA family hydrolase [Pleurocapsa sp. PCC 7319]|uniref:HAD-IA family hydrolase n=1 Tax=Pleurocapsa sp. PCC 7319 TaxID=118161 RepID=UPI000346AC12|nr:HAD-IA family hydrolase [Pleurocapsa sp. PCC 7319]